MSGLQEYFDRLGDLVEAAMQKKPITAIYDDCGVVWERLNAWERKKAIGMAYTMVDLFPNAPVQRAYTDETVTH